MLLTRKYGLQGSVIAFAINYMLYWITMYFITRIELNKMPLEAL
jgi:hypothetical protein